MRVRYQWVVVLIVAAALAVGGFMMLRKDAKTTTPAPEMPGAGTASAVSTGTGSAGVAQAPKVTDIPTPPAGIAQKVAASGVDGLSAEERAAWEAYLAETAKIVSENAEGLRTRLEAAINAINTGDQAALGAMFASDEDLTTEFVVERAGAYPRMNTYKVQPSIGVFSVAKATVYFGYAVVQWEDGGIVSEHTIAIPMRFVNGSWYLTSIGSSTQGITAVQTVRL